MKTGIEHTARRHVGRMAFRLVVAAMVLATAAALWAGAASAGSDASGEKNYIDESFISQIWTAECGFQVHRRNHGHERIWEEPRGGGGVIFRGVFAITVTLTGVESGNTYKFQDAGTDRETLLADGRTQLAIIGRSFPWNSIGRRVELDGETVRISGRTAYDPAAVCARLAP